MMNKMPSSVGEVIAVSGVKVTLRIFDHSNHDTFYYLGEKFKGISIREYVSIQRGFKDIICLVEGEFLDEKRYEKNGDEVSWVRKVEVRPIGYFEAGEFKEGIKYLPLIYDPVFLVKEEEISKIFGGGCDDGFVVGEMLKEEIPISLPWRSLFNSHIGIFGNTGSGKSNTLAKLLTTLFEGKREKIIGKSRFVLIDFNGEYCGSQLVDQGNKKTLVLNSRTDGGDRFPLVDSEFWNLETLSILFQATPSTQRPFLNRLISGRAKFSSNPDSLRNYIRVVFADIFSAASPKPDTLDLLRGIARTLGADGLLSRLSGVAWHAKQEKFFRPNAGIYYGADGIAYENDLKDDVYLLDPSVLDDFSELIVRANLQLIRDLLSGFVQFEHIQPLLKRVESSLSGLRRVIRVAKEGDELFPLVTVVSLRSTNQDVKKVLPLLMVKHFTQQHRETVASPPDKTLHLIVDEAHNILSQQSSREQENWKDYRLELFEEIIKEGRKFGIFITIASQRPADISPTIVSQIHNFFIHRLVNERDLFLLDNTINTLDSTSRSLIPNLSKGCCIATGTSFELPMVMQVHPLVGDRRPDSGDVDIESLWS